MTCRRKKTILILFTVVCAFNALTEPGFAQISKLIRLVSKTPDNVAIKALDNVPTRAVVDKMDSASIEKAVRKEIEQGRRLDDDAYTKELRKLLISELAKSDVQLDAKVLKNFELTTNRELEAALLLGRGGRRISEIVPDLALRGAMLSKIDADTLCALGRYDDLAHEAVRFNQALDLKKLPSPSGVRDLVFTDLGAFFKKTGDAGYNFWQKSVKPHWKLWVGSTALAAVLLAPEEYLDEVGNLTEEGLNKIISFGGTEMASAIKGVGTGVVEVVEQAADAGCDVTEQSGKVVKVIEKRAGSVCRAFFTSKIGIVLSAILILGILLLLRKPLTCLWRLVKI